MNKQDSLWAKYMNEEYNRSVISNDSGFIVYSYHENECVIHDLFIDNESRNEGHGISLCNNLFDQCNKDQIRFVGCFVTMNKDRTDHVTGLVATYIKYGFKIINLLNNQIVMIKEL